MKEALLTIFVSLLAVHQVAAQASPLVTLDFADPVNAVEARGTSVTAQIWDDILLDPAEGGNDFVAFQYNSGTIGFETSDFGFIEVTAEQTGNSSEILAERNGRQFMQEWVIGISSIPRGGNIPPGLGSWTADNNGDGNDFDENGNPVPENELIDPNGNQISWWASTPPDPRDATKNVTLTFSQAIVLTSVKLDGWDGGPANPNTWELNVNGESVSPNPAQENFDFDVTASDLTQSSVDGVEGVFVPAGGSIEFASTQPVDDAGNLLARGNGDNGVLQNLEFFLVGSAPTPAATVPVITFIDVDDSDPREIALLFSPAAGEAGYVVQVSEDLRGPWVEVAATITSGALWEAEIELSAVDYPTVPEKLFFRIEREAEE